MSSCAFVCIYPCIKLVATYLHSLATPSNQNHDKVLLDVKKKKL